MAKIKSITECNEDCENCPYECTSIYRCIACTNHCPCCSGPGDGFCNQCSEEDCDNRNAPYDPSTISKKEE